MRFLRPDLATWFLVLPLSFAFWFLYRRAKQRFRHRVGIGQHLRDISRLSTSARDVITLLAALLALGMLVLAVMRPQLLLERQIPEYQRFDMVLILDRSVSMYAQDIRPSRFARAVTEIKTFLAQKPDTIERVALVGFSGTSLILSQLTKDLGSLFFYLDWIMEDQQLYFGTDIGAAISSGLEVTKKAGNVRPSFYVLLSDGDDHGTTLATALTDVRRQQIRIHTIGVGGEAEVPIPVMELGRQALLRDEDGSVLTTQFSGYTLNQIANVTGGRYFRSVTGTELATAMQDIVSAERKVVGWTTTTEYRDMYREALATAAFAAFFLLIKL